jgi:TonB-linked SusC/RagA family outer membrane protein
MKRRHLIYEIRYIVLLIATFLIPLFSLAQDRTITGKIVDSTGLGIAKANVKIKGMSKATVSTEIGNFTITVPSAETILIISSIGYVTQEIKVGNLSNISVVLRISNETLSDVVIMGYSSQSRSKTTAAISKLNPDELKNTSNPNPTQALQGKLAGVSVPINSGQPGAGPANVIIRGGTKVDVYGSGMTNGGGGVGLGPASNSNPLVVVDGVFRSWVDMNPDNIESIQVMKDAASTAIYGARGANGVIVVKTKGGKFNTKTNVTLNHRTTWETQSREYKYLDAEQYLTLARKTVNTSFDFSPTLRNTLLNNAGFSAGTKIFNARGQFGNHIYTTALYDNILAIEGQDYINTLLAKGYKTMADPLNPAVNLLYYDNNYQDLIWNTGITSNDNVSIDGGSDIAQYNISAGYTNQAGTFIGTRYKRYDVLGNFGLKASKKLRIDAMINYQNVLPNYVEQFQNELIRGVRITPNHRIYKDDGLPQSGESYSVRNRMHTIYYDEVRANTERIISRLAGDYTVLKNLHFKPSVSYAITDTKELFRRKGTPSSDWSQPSTIRQKSEDVNLSRQLMIDQILQYDVSFKNVHHLTSLVGFNYTRNTRNTLNIGSQRGTNDYIFTIEEPSIGIINGVPTTNVTSFGTELSESKSASYFGQLLYDYDSKYLFGGSLRYDGFSNFAPGNKFAYFPSISAGWNIHRESFFNLEGINLLKLRASWGAVGTSDLSISDTYGGYQGTQYAFSSGILRSNLSNPNLKWEKTEVTDIAMDISLLKGRVNITLDFYNKLTKDRLDSKPLPSEAPFNSIRFNNGILQNKGIEVELSAVIIKSNDFTWKTNIAFAKNDQKILKLPDNGRIKNRQGGSIIFDPKIKSEIEVGGLAEGERPFGVWVWKVDGIFSTEAEAAAWNATKVDRMATSNGLSVKKHAGDYIFADINGDNIIDVKDLVFVGYRTPNITGGIQNTFSYKGISLRFNMDYAMGHIIENGHLARALGSGRAFNEGAPLEALGNDIWKQEGDVNKRYARYSLGDADIGQRNFMRQGPAGVGVAQGYGSDVSTMIDKGDFLAFREISISYDLPANTIKKLRISGLNIFGSVYNIGYLTKYKGLNPEVYTGFDPGGYPRARQFSIGLTLKL